jgi:hypothetical protein
MKLLFGGGQEELEYRAKLSEVAFAPEPLIAMNAIFSSNIGQKGVAHGMANLRIMRGLVAWMRAHSSEIKGLNRARPLLPQFDLLTDVQSGLPLTVLVDAQGKIVYYHVGYVDNGLRSFWLCTCRRGMDSVGAAGGG